MVKNLPAIQENWVQSLGWNVPWKREWPPTPVYLPGEFYGQRSLEYGFAKVDTTEQLTFTFSQKALDKLKSAIKYIQRIQNKTEKWKLRNINQKQLVK